MSFDNSEIAQLPHVAETRALLQNDSLNMLTVADRTPAGKDSHGRKPDAQSAKPTGAEATYIDAEKKFNASPDKKAAMGGLGASFETAIKLADVDQQKSAAKALDSLVNVIPRLSKAMNSLEDHFHSAGKSLSKIHNDQERKTVAKDVDDYLGADAKSSRANALAQRLSKYPGLLDAVNGMRADKKEADSLNAELESIKKQGHRADVDRVGTRLGYADALEAAGDKTKAAKYRDQANAILDSLRPAQHPGMKPYLIPLEPVQPVKPTRTTV